MKKQIIPCILLAVLAGCTNESELTSGSDYVSRVTITAKDFVAGDAATRTAFEVSASGLTFKWAATDVVGIYPNEGDQVSFPMTAGAGTNSASFDGGGWALKGNYTYAAYFPYSVDNTTQGRTYTALPITYTRQTQSANNSTADMGNFDYMVAKASTPASGNVNFAFEHVGSVLYVQLVSPVAETFTRLTLSTEDALWTTDATVNIATGVLTPANSAAELSVDLANISVSANGTLYVWLMAVPADMSGKTITASAVGSTGTYTAEIAGKNLLAGKAYQLKGTLSAPSTGGTGQDIGWGDEITGTLDGHDYVDLGLPSGTLWATCNVGATSATDCGDHFAWGETEGDDFDLAVVTEGYDGGKQEFSWSTYKWCQGSSMTITKYCTNSNYGKVDNITELQPSDDAATANWGSNWQMPSIEQCVELIDDNYTITEWTTVSGVNGRKITSKTNGNCIFLPAAGFRVGTSIQNLDSYGEYWTRILFASNSSAGNVFYFRSGSIGKYNSERSNGRSIRPVVKQ